MDRRGFLRMTGGLATATFVRSVEASELLTAQGIPSGVREDRRWDDFGLVHCEYAIGEDVVARRSWTKQGQLIEEMGIYAESPYRGRGFRDQPGLHVLAG